MVNHPASTQKRVLEAPEGRPRKRVSFGSGNFLPSPVNSTDDREKSPLLPFPKGPLNNSKASTRRPIGHLDGSPSNNSKGVQIQTAISHKSTKSGEGNNQVSLSNLLHANGPAKERAWSGIVEIDDGGMRLSEDMSAYPSAKISRKAYEFSKNINSKLHFKLLPRSKCYPRIFQDARPNRDDIALYFYPAKVDRPKRIYSEILRRMKYKNLMMRSCIDGIELLMFPSTILPADLQILDGCFFIWGVFRREEDAKQKAVGM